MTWQNVLRLPVCLLVLGATARLHAYSVLAHEAIIDTAWHQSIRPLLLKRFPNSTPDQLRKAHAYAYGGCILQDMGYYPFGSKYFSNLVHYVRSGDFVMNMIGHARNIEEYAFALGTLAHYASDNTGHPLATNRAVAIQYPKLESKFGREVTYEQDPVAHIKTEFGFDVLEVSQGNYAPQAYHDFIGFEVSKPLLERAFQDTYSLELKHVFDDLDLALETYRRTVSGLIPKMTRVAWAMNKNELKRTRPALTRKQYIYRLSRASYRKEWDRKYKAPGPGANFVAFILRLIPKIGPFKALAFKPPTPATERLFAESFKQTLDLYHQLLADTGAGRLRLQNRNFDTGQATEPAKYGLADDTYAKLTRDLSRHDPTSINPKLREDILNFYKNPNAPTATKRHRQEWHDTMEALAKLQAR